jgi:hypothetical protein
MKAIAPIGVAVCAWKKCINKMRTIGADAPFVRGTLQSGWTKHMAKKTMTNKIKNYIYNFVFCDIT